LPLIAGAVTGIFFENKADYATWFSSSPGCIHGIQMLPMTPISELVRTPAFVRQEWYNGCSNLTVAGWPQSDLATEGPCLRDVLQRLLSEEKSGWAGVLASNLAIIEPDAAFDVLRRCSLDDGQSRAWSLYWAATRPRVHEATRSDLLAAAPAPVGNCHSFAAA
jgi:endo-1,3(4)-beta-glucanase